MSKKGIAGIVSAAVAIAAVGYGISTLREDESTMLGGPASGAAPARSGFAVPGGIAETVTGAGKDLPVSTVPAVPPAAAVALSAIGPPPEMPRNPTKESMTEYRKAVLDYRKRQAAAQGRLDGFERGPNRTGRSCRCQNGGGRNRGTEPAPPA